MKKKTKKIYLSGGLGNNLFQMSYAERLSTDHDVIFNTYLQKKNWFTRKLGWSIHPTEICDFFLDNKEIEVKFNVIDYIFTAIVFILSKIGFCDLHHCDKAPSFWNRTYSKFEIESSLNEGFLRRLNSKLNELNIDNIQKQFSLDIIHVRRGDFGSNIQLDIDYYKNAITMHGGESFVVVTNDINCIHHLRSEIKGVEFIDSVGKSQKEDLFIMKNARSIILSNSTFSYWASQIGNVPIVYHPSKIKNRKKWVFPLVQKSHLVKASFGGW